MIHQFPLKYVLPHIFKHCRMDRQVLHGNQTKGVLCVDFGTFTFVNFYIEDTESSIIEGERQFHKNALSSQRRERDKNENHDH